MARRKQSLPARAKGTISQKNYSAFDSKNDSKEVCTAFTDDTTGETSKLGCMPSKLGSMPCLSDAACGVIVYSPVSASDSVVDIAEVSLEAAVYQASILSAELREHTNGEPLKVRLHLSSLGRDYMVGLRALSVEDVRVEVLEQCDNPLESPTLDAKESNSRIIVSGYLDGPDESISGFAYLFKAGFIIMKPYLRVDTKEDMDSIELSCRLRIGVTQKAFDSCNGLLDGAKSLWSRSMLKVMKWLRPDLHTDESIYGIPEHDSSKCLSRNCVQHSESSEQELEGRRQQGFDPSILYEAIRPDQNEPSLNSVPPQLLAKLRPYQSRAAYWMVTREKKSQSLVEDGGHLAFENIKWPFCSEVVSLDKKSVLYYNPFSGLISQTRFESFPDIRGGILADEMGLGKTVELLACIMTNPYKSSTSQPNQAAEKATKELHGKLMKRKRERIACPCGAEEDESYSGIWVQCDCCDVWQHAPCVGFGMEYEYSENFEREISASRRESNSPKMREKKRKRSADRTISVREERYTVNEDYICGSCSRLIGSVEVDGVCGATLIVCPSSILGQWQEEIARHTEKGALKVIVYEGFQRGGGPRSGEQVRSAKYGKVVGAHELAKADIVLTTYSTLQADLSHDTDGDDGDQRTMRYIKRYPVVPTPLTRIKWWRVCLDEAQMVESSAARATEMAKRLNAEIHWCITGTPMQRGLDDLHGLLRFLDLQPFNDFFWWTRILKEPYERSVFGAMTFMHNYLKRFMWRSSKAHIRHELDLPPQEELLTWLTFSPIEAHFYRRQHDRCARKAMEAMSESSGFTSRSQNSKACEDRTLTHIEAAKVLHPLLSLRQACCHPQVGSSGLRSLQKSPMTMDEVLKVLLEKAKTEGEEAQRSLVGALNGLAALRILEQDFAGAVKIYREALSSTEENAEEFDMDPLQKLHVLHNLHDVLETLQKESSGGHYTHEGVYISKKRPGDQSDDFTALHAVKMQRLDGGKDSESKGCTVKESKDIGFLKGESSSVCGVPRTLRDSLLEQQCQDISAKYMSSFYAKLSAVRQDYTNAHNQVCKYWKDLEDMQGATWWLDALASLPNGSKQAKELVQKIKDSLLEKDALALSRRGHYNASSLALRFDDINGLKYILNRELDAIVDHREKLIAKISDIDQMMDSPSAEDVERAGNCSNCDHRQKGPLCAHCEIDQLYQMYENRLFWLRSSAANVGEVVSLEDAFTAQQRMLSLKRMNTVKMAARSCGSSEDKLLKEESKSKATEISNIQVTRSPSETENILKLIKANMRQKLGRDLVAASTKHLEVFEAMRKEYAQARLLAVSQRMVLLALDELNMAKTRLCLKFPGEEASHASDEIFKLHLEEIPQRNAQLTGDKFIALDDLLRAKGQFRYLKGLAITRERSRKIPCTEECNFSQSNDGETLTQEKVENSSDKKPGVFGGNVEETCPVCQESLGMQMMVLPCGHMLCCKCLMTIADNDAPSDSNPEMKRVSCPSCRYRTHMENIAFIDNGLGETSYSLTISKLQNKEVDAESSISVKGSYGTKMEAVIKRIIRVQASDQNSRFLVFSTWNDVLDVVEHSLSANKIGFIRAKGRRNLEAAIRSFKGKDEGGEKSARVILLLIQQGANGLNLTEAQHVILIEPLLNPGAEAQAVNRVHRIGQQHTTYVHRFLIKDTVEESIYKLSQLKSHSPNGASMGRKSNQEVSTLTVKDLKMLFKSGTDDCRQPLQAGTCENTSGDNNLRELPPSAAAAAAAEARLRQALNGVPSNT